MVTAILIPIICIYFYWITKKDKQEYEQKWLNLITLHEESIITGKIVNLTETKRRFYYHRFIHVIDIQLQTETKLINVKRITPYLKQNKPVGLKAGDFVRLYGNWLENEFRFLRFDVLK